MLISHCLFFVIEIFQLTDVKLKELKWHWMTIFVSVVLLKLLASGKFGTTCLLLFPDGLNHLLDMFVYLWLGVLSNGVATQKNVVDVCSCAEDKLYPPPSLSPTLPPSLPLSLFTKTAKNLEGTSHHDQMQLPMGIFYTVSVCMYMSVCMCVCVYDYACAEHVQHYVIVM